MDFIIYYCIYNARNTILLHTTYNVRCTMFDIQCTTYNVRHIQCIVYVIQCTIYVVLYTVYNVHCTLYSVGHTMYTVCRIRETIYCTVYGARYDWCIGYIRLYNGTIDSFNYILDIHDYTHAMYKTFVVCRTTYDVDMT